MAAHRSVRALSSRGMGRQRISVRTVGRLHSTRRPHHFPRRGVHRHAVRKFLQTPAISQGSRTGNHAVRRQTVRSGNRARIHRCFGKGIIELLTLPCIRLVHLFPQFDGGNNIASFLLWVYGVVAQNLLRHPFQSGHILRGNIRGRSPGMNKKNRLTPGRTTG